MKNFISNGNTWEIPSPAALSAGAPVSVGSVVLVATNDFADGDTGTFLRRGIVELPKASGTGFAIGDACFLVDSSGEIDASGDTYAGVVTRVAETTDATVFVELAATGPQGIQGIQGIPG